MLKDFIAFDHARKAVGIIEAPSKLSALSHAAFLPHVIGVRQAVAADYLDKDNILPYL